MYAKLLILRYRQLVAIGRSLGLVRSIVFGFLAILLSYLMLGSLVAISEGNPWILIFVFTVLVASAHLSRTDKKIRQILFAKATFRSYLFEYLVLSIPLFLLLSIQLAWLPVLAYLALLFSISLTNHTLSISNRSAGLSFFSGQRNFEWKSGLRKKGVELILVYILAFAALKLPFVSLFITFLVLAIIITFYEHFEDYKLVEVFRLSANSFLKKKIVIGITSFNLAISIITVPYSVIHPEHLAIAVIFHVLSTIIICHVIILKYTFYQPNQSSGGNKLANFLSILTIPFPFLIPLPLLMSIRNFKRAVSNLNNYLYDFHS